MFRLRPFVIAIALVVALPAVVSADAPPGPYFNGFETNTAGWSPFSGGTITRRPDFYSPGVGAYASGVDSAEGGYHARLGIDPMPHTCPSGGGPQPVYRGPVTDWGGYSAIFPTGGYRTGVDIYLDVQWAQTHFDRRFDWSSAINRTNGMHLRDFMFNAGTDPLGFVISAGFNGDRCSSFPANPGNQPIHITTSGWYTFEHSFTGVTGGPLVVVMRILDANGVPVPGASWVRSVPTDTIGTMVGGNRYGWFVQNEIDQLAIDNSFRTGIVSTEGCEIKINNGGWIVAMNGDQGTFGGNAKVSMSGETSGQQQYQDHGPLQPLNFKATTVQAVICSDDRTSAEIYGVGTVDGMGSYEYQIKLTDAGEPGTGDKYGILIPGVGYASGDQDLQGGNVQIR
jgi:hypothetical protein